MIADKLEVLIGAKMKSTFQILRSLAAPQLHPAKSFTYLWSAPLAIPHSNYPKSSFSTYYQPIDIGDLLLFVFGLIMIL